MRQVAVISGGSRGIGLAIANYMINDGFITCVIGQREESLCTDAFASLKEKGELYYFQGSVAVESDRQAFVDSIVSRYGRIDVLVNNAGVAPKVRMDLLAATEESFDHVMSVNLKGTMFLTQAAAKVMVSQPKKDGLVQGVIVNMSSFSAWVSSPNRAEYCVSKAGISMLTKLYADRLARDGIYVYEVQPGIIRTDMTSSVTEKYDRLLSQGQFPIARWGTPEDVANVVSLLVKGNMSYTTGQVIHVDGGYADVRSL